MKDLNSSLLAAHDKGDTAQLVTLYAQAADRVDSLDAAGFYLTQAYIYALEIAHPSEQRLRERLVAMGRETPL